MPGQSAASSRAKKKIDFLPLINPRGGDEASVVDASLAGGTFQREFVPLPFLFLLLLLLLPPPPPAEACAGRRRPRVPIAVDSLSALCRSLGQRLAERDRRAHLDGRHLRDRTGERRGQLGGTSCNLVCWRGLRYQSSLRFRLGPQPSPVML